MTLAIMSDTAVTGRARTSRIPPLQWRGERGATPIACNRHGHGRAKPNVGPAPAAEVDA